MKSTNHRLLTQCAVVVVAWAVLQVTLLQISDTSPLRGRLIDTDSYMRLVRIEELAAGDGWYDDVIERSNAPYGDDLHWTRPFDAMVIAGAIPLLPVVERDDALFWSGAAMCPLLQLAALFAIVWAAAPLVGRRSPLLVAAFMVQPVLWSAFGPGKLDHHALQVLLFVVLFGLGLRLMNGDGGRRAAAMAGVVAGFGIWVSVEMAIPLLVLLAALGARWLWGEAAAPALGFLTSAASTLTLAVALVIERPPAALGSADLDRISIVHLTALALCSAAWAGIAVASRYQRPSQTLSSRAVVLGGCGLMAIVGLAMAFPRALLGPDADIDPAIRPIWLDKVVEMRPLVPNSGANLGPFLLLAGQSLIGLPAAALILRKARADPSFAGWAYAAALLAVYLAMALEHARAATFLTVPVSVMVAEGLIRLRAPLARIGVPLVRSLTWAGATVGSLVGFLLVGGVVTAANANEVAGPAGEACHIDEIAPFLSDPAGLGADTKIIAASIDFGPQILYETPHAVVAGPYHRNADGILDLYTVLAGTPPEAFEIVTERGIDLVLLCPSPEERAFVQPMPGSLYFALAEGSPPAWLEPIPVPADARDRFSLFRVTDEH